MTKTRKWIIFLILTLTYSSYSYCQPGTTRHLPCRDCDWMAHSLHLSDNKAKAYYTIIHNYLAKIDKEVRYANRNPKRADAKIRQLRIERERKIRSILTPAQFRLYVRFCKERTSRIHEQPRWFNNSNYHRRYWANEQWHDDDHDHDNRRDNDKGYKNDNNKNDRKESGRTPSRRPRNND